MSSCKSRGKLDCGDLRHAFSKHTPADLAVIFFHQPLGLGWALVHSAWHLNSELVVRASSKIAGVMRYGARILAQHLNQEIYIEKLKTKCYPVV